MNDQWLSDFNAELQKLYGISIRDKGWDNDDLKSYYEHLSPFEAVISFGERYGLIPINQ